MPCQRLFQVVTCLVLWTALSGALVAAALTGRVVLDANANGAPDPDEPGIAGVLVSDGHSVTRTDASGRYRLDPTVDRTLLRVTVPRDHAVQTPFWRWTEGKEPVDFTLVSRPQPESFFMVHVTDAHVGRVDLLKQFVERLNQFPLPLAFVVNTGDLVGGVDVVPVDKAKEQFDRYLDGVRALRVPLFNLPGNHEHVAFQVKEADRAHPYYGKGLYREMLGPTYYSWDWGPYHFIALDGTTLPYAEKLGAEQLEWLRADLASTPMGTPLVLFCHQSLPALRDAAELAAALQGRPVVAAFCGHLHETSVKALGAIPVYHTGALSGSWWSGPNPDGSPQGFALIKLADGKAQFVYSAREGTHSLYVSTPNSAAAMSGSFPFEAVVLDGGQAVTVSARAGDADVAVSRGTRGEFWSVWQGKVDTTAVPDGLLTLQVTAALGETRSSTTAQYLVLNGREEPYQAGSDAVLKLQVRGVEADDEVLLHGERLGVLAAGTPNESTLEFPIPATALRRLNRVTVRAVAPPGAADKDDFSVGPLWLEVAGKRIHDIRFASFARHQIGDNNPKAYPAERDFYLCLP